MENAKKYCSLCMNLISDSKSVAADENRSEKLIFILQDLEQSIEKSHSICRNCELKIENAFKFKKLLFDIKENKQPCLSNGAPELELSIKETLVDNTVCYLCDATVTVLSVMTLPKVLKDVNICQVFSRHIPEIELNFRNNLVICESCQKSLSDFSMLIRIWANAKKNKNNIVEDGFQDQKMEEDFEDHIIEDRFPIVENNSENFCEVLPEFIHQFNLSYCDIKIGQEPTKPEQIKADNTINTILTCDEMQKENEKFIIGDDGADKDYNSSVTVKEQDEMDFEESSITYEGLEMKHLFHKEEALEERFLDHIPKVRIATSDTPVDLNHKLLRVVLQKLNTCGNNVLENCSNSTRKTRNNKEINKNLLNSTNAIEDRASSKQKKKSSNKRRYIIENNVDKKVFYTRRCYSEASAYTEEKNFKFPECYKCPSCSFKSKSEDNFRLHIHLHNNSILPVEKSSEKRLYECNNCPYKTFVRQHFERHSVRYLKPDDIKMEKCEHCSYQTKFKASLKQHMKLHKKCMFYCNNCSYKCKSKTLLIQHMVIHRLNYKLSNDSFYECLHCPYKTNAKGRFLRHLIQMHANPDQIIIYKCTKCTYQTKLEGNLKEHMKVHRKSTTLLECQLCTYNTYDKYNLGKHKNIHKIQYNCKQCRYHTASKCDLKKHSRKHKKSLLYCYKCSYETKFKYRLVLHIKTHATPPKKCIRKCQYCDFETKDQQYFKKHLSTHENCDEFGYHNCTECDYRTKFKLILIRHLKIHERTGFPCEHCSHVADSRYKLKNHMIVHQTRKEAIWYKCLLCKYETKYHNNLKSHISRLHEEEIDTDE